MKCMNFYTGSDEDEKFKKGGISCFDDALFGAVKQFRQIEEKFSLNALN